MVSCAQRSFESCLGRAKFSSMVQQHTCSPRLLRRSYFGGQFPSFVIPEFREDPSDKHEELNKPSLMDLNCTRMCTHHRIVPLRVVLAMRPLQRRWRNLLQRWWLGLKSTLSLSNFSSETMFDSTQGAKAKEGVEEVQVLLSSAR